MAAALRRIQFQGLRTLNKPYLQRCFYSTTNVPDLDTATLQAHCAMLDAELQILNCNHVIMNTRVYLSSLKKAVEAKDVDKILTQIRKTKEYTKKQDTNTKKEDKKDKTQEQPFGTQVVVGLIL